MSESDDGSRWTRAGDVQRGADYDARWSAMEARGESVHGEADFVCRLEPQSVLDAGCGTGRVAIELAARGIDVVGVDLDEPMLVEARRKAPRLAWITADLATVDVGRRFDVVMMAGNVMIFVAPGAEPTVVANMAAHVADGGSLVAGFQLAQGYLIERYDADSAAAGFELHARYSTWDRQTWRDSGDYAVSVHRRRHS